MKHLIEQIITLGNVMRQRDGFTDLAVAAPPATTSALARATRDLAGRISPSFLQFLALNDGVRNFDWVDLSIHGAEYLCEHPHLDADYALEDWAIFEPYTPNSLFIFGEGGPDSLLAFRTTEGDSEGEFPVVEFDVKGPIWEFPNFVAYLEGRLEWFRQYAR